MKARCWIAALILGLSPMAADAQEEIIVTGRAVNAAGQPVAGADIAVHWDARDGKMEPYQGTTTNAEGRFTLPFTFRGRKYKLMAVSKDRKSGGFVGLEEKSAREPVEIKLAPLVHVHGQLIFKAIDKRPSYANLAIVCDTSLLLRYTTTDGSFSFRLPPADYRMSSYAPGGERVSKTIALKPEALDVNLGTIDIAASFLTQHKGKALPAWHVSDVRGAAKGVKLSDYKGKWVLLEFWGYW